MKSCTWWTLILTHVKGTWRGAKERDRKGVCELGTPGKKVKVVHWEGLDCGCQQLYVNSLRGSPEREHLLSHWGTGEQGRESSLSVLKWYFQTFCFPSNRAICALHFCGCQGGLGNCCALKRKDNYPLALWPHGSWTALSLWCKLDSPLCPCKHGTYLF